MKYFFLLSLCTIMIYGCTQEENTEQTTKNNQENIIQQITPLVDTTGKIGSLTIMNKMDYHQDFIADLQNAPLGDVVLNKNKMTEGNDVFLFPIYPKLEKRTTLSANINKLTVNIVIYRINQTTIDYRVEFWEEGNTKVAFQSSGEATISASSMYLGSESDENELTGNSYEATEYMDSYGEDCYTYIRLGKDDDNGKLLGRLIKNCNEQYDDIDLDFAMFTEVE